MNDFLKSLSMVLAIFVALLVIGNGIGKLISILLGLTGNDALGTQTTFIFLTPFIGLFTAIIHDFQKDKKR